jgi:uncharacterized glyoxalase superfamily protein PhnB
VIYVVPTYTIFSISVKKKCNSAVDALYRTAVAQGLTPTPPQDGAWGERYFHLMDPNGHELSFAQVLPRLAETDTASG